MTLKLGWPVDEIERGFVVRWAARACAAVSPIDPTRRPPIHTSPSASSLSFSRLSARKAVRQDWPWEAPSKTYTRTRLDQCTRTHACTRAHARRGKRDRLNATGSAGAAARLSPGPRERFRRPPCWRAHRRSLRPAGGTCLSPALCLFPACVSSIFRQCLADVVNEQVNG